MREELRLRLAHVKVGSIGPLFSTYVSVWECLYLRFKSTTPFSLINVYYTWVQIFDRYDHY